MRRFSKWIGFFLMAALVFANPLWVNAEEDPHKFKAGESPYWFKPGEGPLPLPSNKFLKLSEDIRLHNNRGIDEFLTQNFRDALDHFEMAAQLDPNNGILAYNEAITLDRLNRHREATQRFQQAKDLARGNQLILNSPVLQSHLSHP
ncbi:tetratricopeptide repeat protein [Nitrospina watsonii]|uniref:TPR_REGION domain-containing protein n=1 Tax=Nitrospina watsonii TaxID=1323948 RepID=A0ABM9HGJ6_9BACT|nr:tetratricopeptide repeat protein [Nitrospina watsonii]CAI2719348.1 TPR_REGION domain-containing protein [Nitrospina watsonii]